MELKEVIKFLNIEEITEESSLDDLKEKFNTRFSLTEEIEKEKKNLGKRLGSATTDIKKLFKENGVEFEDGEKINIKDLDYKIIKDLIWWK